METKVNKPEHRFIVIGTDQINTFRKDICDIGNNLKELGHEDLDLQLEKLEMDLLIPNFELIAKGLDFEIVTDAGELIGSGSFDEERMEGIGIFNMKYWTGIDKEELRNELRILENAKPIIESLRKELREDWDWMYFDEYTIGLYIHDILELARKHGMHLVDEERDKEKERDEREEEEGEDKTEIGIEVPTTYATELWALEEEEELKEVGFQFRWT